MNTRHDEYPEPRAARADARDGSPRRSAWLEWTDPETGDRLRLELSSPEAFLSGLAAAGFQPLAHVTPSGPGGGGVRPSAGSILDHREGDAA